MVHRAPLARGAAHPRCGALILTPEGGWLELLGAGLALGLAAGTKYTFLVPGVILVVGAIAAAPRRDRMRAGALLVAGLAVTGGWWYLRAALHTGNPLGLRQDLGPLHLPGARSPLAEATQQTVFSEIRHLSRR
jgi:4-amino-4-deoxy-L-arabinose transferase-like glycosyltransferase